MWFFTLNVVVVLEKANVSFSKNAVRHCSPDLIQDFPDQQFLNAFSVDVWVD